MKNLNHLEDIHQNYDTYIIDLWGVIHNGISLNPKAIDAIDNLQKKSKDVVFLSNAPRPSSNVREFLKQINMKEKYLSKIITSGEAAMHAINQKKFGEKFFHLGPTRDNSIFESIKENKTDIENCNFIICTGLFDEHDQDLDYYKHLLKEHTDKQLLCTNPDLIVHRGNVEELCAGAIAKTFEKLGGNVIYYGKPYEEIYKMCFTDREKVLAIGDNLRTDIKGANNLKIDNIFIYNGVHRNEINSDKDLPKLFEKYKVNVKYFQKELQW